MSSVRWSPTNCRSGELGDRPPEGPLGGGVRVSRRTALVEKEDRIGEVLEQRDRRRHADFRGRGDSGGTHM
jgi:hypothetical protein